MKFVNMYDIWFHYIFLSQVFDDYTQANIGPNMGIGPKNSISVGAYFLLLIICV